MITVAESAALLQATADYGRALLEMARHDPTTCEPGKRDEYRARLKTVSDVQQKALEHLLFLIVSLTDLPDLTEKESK